MYSWDVFNLRKKKKEKWKGTLNWIYFNKHANNNFWSPKWLRFTDVWKTKNNENDPLN